MDFVVLSVAEDKELRKIAEDLLKENMELKKRLKEDTDRAFSEGVSFVRNLNGGKA